MYYSNIHFEYQKTVSSLLDKEEAVGIKFIIGLDRISMYSNIKKQELIFVGIDTDGFYYKFLNKNGDVLMIYCLDIVSITELKD